MWKGSVAVLLIIACMVGWIGESEAQQSTTEPVPYERDEFPEVLHAIRRFEIIAIGAFPVTYLLAFLVYDVGKFIDQSIQAGQVSNTYAPLFFAPPNKPPLEQEEIEVLILGAVGAAVGVAIIDLIIQAIKNDQQDEEQ